MKPAESLHQSDAEACALDSMEEVLVLTLEQLLIEASDLFDGPSSVNVSEVCLPFPSPEESLLHFELKSDSTGNKGALLDQGRSCHAHCPHTRIREQEGNAL